MVHLDLSRNYISEFYFVGSRENASTPGFIDLRYNNISELGRTTLDSLIKLGSATIRLENNPIDCNCDRVTHLYQFLQEFRDLGRYEYLRKLSCASPSHLLEREVGSLTEDLICPQVDASPVELTIICSILGAAVLLLIVVFAFLIRYSEEVIILLYTRMRIKLPCRKMKPLPVKSYDVFISACESDRHWAMQHVVSFLQDHKRKSFRLCLKDDWEIGVPIADEVTRSVESSVHTIAIISRNYVSDEWSQFEFSAALLQSLVEKRRHLVVVFKEDFPKHHLPSDMRKYVTTTPCIHHSRQFFRDRLFYVLSCGDPARKSIPSNTDSDISVLTSSL